MTISLSYTSHDLYRDRDYMCLVKKSLGIRYYKVFFDLDLNWGDNNYKTLLPIKIKFQLLGAYNSLDCITKPDGIT